MNDQQNNLDEIVKQQEKTIAGFFVQKFRVTYVILFAIVLMGGFALLTLPREADPEVKIPFALVTTIFPGASPTDVEDLVTNKIEDKIKNLENLRRYTSSSGTSVSTISLEFEAEADLKESISKLKDAVDTAKPNLPADAEDPVVTEIRANDIPIVTYSLVGDYSDTELKAFADILQTELEGIRDVSKVPILGGVTREFQIEIDQTRMHAFGLSLGQIVNAISKNNFNLPAGTIEVDGFNYGVRVQGTFTEAVALNDIVITTAPNGDPVYIRDVAQVKDTFREKSTESRIGFAARDGEVTAPKNTVSLQVFKRTGGNILKMADAANARVAELQTDSTFPKNLEILKTNDNSVFIRQDLSTLGRSGIQTMILIFLLLWLVIGFRESIITSLSVPIAFLITFVALSLQGMTINSIVLFSLVLSLGLMVDNTIVIIEGINEYMDEHGKSAREAALLSVWNYKWPIIAGTLTTVSAFVPMLLVSGILGEFISFIPKTITPTLLSSLFVALIVLPALAARMIKKDGNTRHPEQAKHSEAVLSAVKDPVPQTNDQIAASLSTAPRNDTATHTQHRGFVERGMKVLKAWYDKTMRAMLASNKKRRRFIAGAWVVFVLSLVLPFSGLMRVEMFPSVDFEYFVVNIELPVGSTLDKTRTITAKAENIIAQLPELDNYVTNLGTTASLGLSNDFGNTDSSSEHLATITVNLVDTDERKRKSFDITESVRGELTTITGGVVSIEELSAGPPTGAPIEARITGDTISELIVVADALVQSLESIEGTLNVKDSVRDSVGEFTFTIDKQKANYYGLDIASVSQTLRGAIYGIEASSVTAQGDDVDIIVQYGSDAFTTVTALENLLLPVVLNGNRTTIPLKQIAEVELLPSVQSIAHRDGDRVVTVSASVEEGVNLQKVLAQFDTARAEIEAQFPNVTIDVGGEVEDIQKSFTETFYSMIVAVILIGFILVLQFNSFRQPFIILFTLPLAIIGVIIGLTLTGQPFSFPAFIGIVALAGIVVNDAIVLIDKVNKNVNATLSSRGSYSVALAKDNDRGDLINQNDDELLLEQTAYADQIASYASTLPRNDKNNPPPFLIEAVIDAGKARMQPVLLTSITTIAGIFPLVFANEVWLGLSLTVIFGLLFATILTLVMVPTMYVGIIRKELISRSKNR